MIKSFLSFISEKIDIGPHEERLIYDNLRIKDYQKGELLLSRGQISREFYFILSGFVRLYYIKDFEEKTTYFYPEYTFVSAYESFVKQEPTDINLQAMEDTKVIVIDLSATANLLSGSSKFESLARIAMEDELAANQTMIRSLLVDTPEERYYKLMEKHPELFQRVSQHYIASYIGVKPESLSRIKKRYLEKIKS